MPPERRGDLTSEMLQSARGLARLLRLDPAWGAEFTLTAGGFVRSFCGPMLALPLYLFSSAIVTRAMQDGQPAGLQAMELAGLEHLIDALGYPLLIAIVAKALKMSAGYAGFVIVTNWASLYLNLGLAIAALLAGLGADGLAGFELLDLVLLFLSIFVVWRAARETLSREFAPVLLVVVLSVAWSAMADQLGRRVLGAS